MAVKKSKPIIVLPSYIYSALFARGYNFNKLEIIHQNLLTNVDFIQQQNLVRSVDTEWYVPIKKIFDVLSLNDIKDIINVHTLIKENFNIDVSNLFLDAIYVNRTILNDKKHYLETISYLQNNDSELVYNFIVSNNKDKYDDLFYIENGETCYFLVLNNGFCNFTTMTNVKALVDFKIKFLSILFNYVTLADCERTAVTNYGILGNLLNFANFKHKTL